MSHIQKRGPKRWTARYADPDGRERAKSFQRQVDAQRFLHAVQQSIQQGTYVDASAGLVTVAEWADGWLKRQAHLSPTTRARYRSVITVHLRPRWGNVRLSGVTHEAAQTWVAGLPEALSPASVQKVYRVFSMILDLAVRDRRLAHNPCQGIRLPRPAPTRRQYLSHRELLDLAAACSVSDSTNNEAVSSGYTYRLVVLLLGYCGLRWGELAGLRVRSLDSMRRRLEISETVVELDGHQILSSPKSGGSRSVPVPAFLIDELRVHVDGREPHEYVFRGVRGGGPLRNRVFRRAAFDAAAIALGFDGLTPHELRHTAASLAVSEGANVLAVSRMLGHASAKLTLDTYADLFDDDLDAVSSRLNAAVIEARRKTSDGR